VFSLQKKATRLLMAGALSLLFTGSAAFALCVNPWYAGTWDCSIDGRPALMVWELKSGSSTTCRGDTCSRTHDACTIHGWFREKTGDWVYLKKNEANSNEIHFTYTGDQSPWYLQRFAGSTTAMSGHTTWAGKHYPLSCTRRR
jgi:hypothetical protein